MTKRILTAIVLAGLMTGSAFASNAREGVLFSGDGGAYLNKGSFYYDSMYNVFYNPAYVNDFKNWVIFEKNAANSAEGGFVTSMMNFNFGLYLNRQANSNGVKLLNNSFASSAAGLAGMNPIDVIFGGDSGVKWGIGLTYAAYHNSAATVNTVTGNTNANALIVRGGVSVGELDPFFELRLKDNAKANKATGALTTTEEKNTGWAAGLRYHWGEWTPYGVYNHTKQTITGTGAANSSTNKYVIGFGRSTKLGEGARLMYALAAAKMTTDTGGVKAKNFVLPLNMGAEADATSWLTLRAGMQYNVFNNTSGSGGTGTSGTNNVLARMGGTFHAGKADVEYAFGNSLGGTTAPGTYDSPAVGFDSETFHTVSLSYKW